jgi:YidC/Oxa1 family membrane protein insertase
MERRVLLAIFLSFLVLSVYQTLVVKPLPKRPPSTPANTPAESSAPTAAAPEPQASAAPATNPPAERAQAATPLVSENAERDVRIETNEVLAVFTNRGARLKSWRLKKYKDAKGEPQELIESGLAVPGPGGTLERQPLPFTLKTPDAAATARLNDALYALTGNASSPHDLRFEYRDSSGLQVAKQFHLDAGSYVLTFLADARQNAQPLPVTILWGPGLADTVEVSRYSQKPGGLLFQNGKAQRLAPKDTAKQAVYEGDFGFAGVDDNYFMAVALSVSGVRVGFQPVAIPPLPPSKDPPRELMAYSIEPRSGDDTLKFFVGPKDFGVLTAVNRDLQNAINFGMFKVIVVPLLQSLKWVNSFVGNYGWSIVVLTILINAIMFPLRHKSTVSMRKMQEIQPQVKAIQDRYAKLKATDPAKQKMNQELMALYRERGVNPASGCVPMLLTMPVLLAMWALLQTSIELRGAPWFGWIHDLSAHDPYYVLAVLMGVTGFWQQRMMPAAGGADPAQQKMMMFMPLMMTVMLAWLPAGALIYYVVTNIWMIGQQYLTNYLIGPPNIRTVRPPAERRLKRAVGGKPEPAGPEAE